LKPGVAWRCFLLLVVSTGDALPEEPIRDGYAAWVDFSRVVSELQGEVGQETLQLTNEAMAEARDLPPASLNQLQHLDAWWGRMENIANAAEWKGVPKEEITPSTEYPYFAGGFQGLILGTTKGYHLLSQGRVTDGIDLLLAFNRIGQRFAVSGSLIHGLVYQAARRKSYPVLMKGLADLPDEEREAYHGRFLEQYQRFPSFQEVTEGERFLFRNGVDMVIPDGGGIETLPEGAMEKLIAHLRKQGTAEDILTGIQKGEWLSSAQWRAQILQEVEAFLKMAYLELEGLPTRDFSSHQDKVTERFSDEEYDRRSDEKRHHALSVAFEQALRYPTHSFPELLRIHEELGRDLTRSYLQVMPPGVHAAARHHRAFLAMEHLFLIESAQRVYVLRHKRVPQRLQDLVEAGLIAKEITLDPLTDEPFRKMNGHQAKWYSVGPDLEDDGGSKWLEEDGDWWLEAAPFPE